MSFCRRASSVCCARSSEYKVELGIPFWAYATWWVRQAMQQAVSELSRPLVLSDRALRQLARVKKAQRALEQSEGRTATCQDLAQAVGLPRSQVESLIFAAADKHEAHKELGVLEIRLLRETMWSAPRSCWSMCGIRTSIR
jgi:hypothetical protein